MVFSSLVFLYAFLPLTLLTFFIIKNQTYRNFILILASLLFYAWGEPVWVSLLLFTVLVDYYFGLKVEKYRGRWQSKAALISAITANLAVLAFFKYASFFAENINLLLHTQLPYYQYGLPLGISFYTFQAICYVVDVYRGEMSCQKSFPKLLLYISLFPQLVAGPIVRYKDIAQQIDQRVITPAGFSEGITRFTIGLAKKVLLANTAGELAGTYLNGNLAEASVLGAWLGITLFALQIYFDFSGYSDMAIGVGRMFGFTFKENFNHPYVSTSATEFWRRWHISLGSFFRDYVYIPLGGNRSHHIRNMFVVWFLTGFWHGASWNFIVWGLYYGLLIMLEKKFLLSLLAKLPKVVSHVYLLVAALVGWVFFYYTEFPKAVDFLGIMFGLTNHQLANQEVITAIYNNCIFLALAIIGCTPVRAKLQSLENPWGFYLAVGKPVVCFALLIVCSVLLVGNSYNPFLYFRF